jgi:four helix bundle protein
MWDLGCGMWDVGCEGNDTMTPEEMKSRTKAFALRVVKLVEALPRTRTADVLGRQLLRAGTSVGANYRAVRRAKSKADFLHKLTIVEEEADECGYWLELLADAGVVKTSQLAPLMQEAHSLTAIIVATIRTTKGK